MKQRPSFPARFDRAAVGSRVLAAATTAAADKTRVQTQALVGARSAEAPRAMRAVSAPESGSVAARRKMVKQLAGQGVSDAGVLGAMGTIERHRFVDTALRGQAYEDTSLPIGLGQTISKPGVVSRMLALLRNGREGRLGRVLEIGTGCGYQAAVLSLLAQEVYTIERLRGLHDRARENLRELRLANVHLLFGDGMAGFAKGAPYAGIIAAAGGEAVPPAWTEQLAVGGRIVAPVSGAAGAPGQQALVVIDKTRHGLHQTVFEGVHFVPLKSGIA